MGQVLVSEFCISIERHLEESHKTWTDTGSRTAPTPGTSAEIAFKEMPTSYLDGLQDLYNKVFGRSATYPHRNYAWLTRP